MLADPPRLIIPIFMVPRDCPLCCSCIWTWSATGSERYSAHGGRRSRSAGPRLLRRGSRALEEAPEAPGQGLSCESHALWWATRQRGQYQPQSGPIFQSAACGLTPETGGGQDQTRPGASESMLCDYEEITPRLAPTWVGFVTVAPPRSDIPHSSALAQTGTQTRQNS